jgi:hypothetical protein
MHISRLRNIKSILNNKAPKQYSHLIHKNKTKTGVVKHIET